MLIDKLAPVIAATRQTAQSGQTGIRPIVYRKYDYYPEMAVGLPSIHFST